MPAPRFLPFFIGGVQITVTVTNPLTGATITDASPSITWSFAPGVQQSYRVRIWGDEAKSQLVYDSGNVISGAPTHIVPDGSLLSSQTYYLVVSIETASADQGESDLTSFSTLFVPSVAVGTVTTTPEHDDCGLDSVASQRALPSVKVDWDEVTPAGDETFVRYSVWRRPRLHPSHPDAGTEVWSRIASVTTVTTTTYRDYCAAAHVVYEYAVTWTAQTDAGDTRVSERQSPPPNALLRFERAVLHDVTDPSLFVVLTPQSVDVNAEQDMTLHRVWGRKAPTAFVTDFASALIDIQIEPEVHRGPIWRDLTGLQRRQQVSHTLCLRLGYSGERYFAAIASPLKRQDGVRQHNHSVSLAETFYEEVVA